MKSYMLIGLVVSLLIIGGVFSWWFTRGSGARSDGQVLNHGAEPSGDQQVLDQLSEAGSNLEKPHDIEFFLYFPTELSAHAAAEEIRNEGAEVEVRLGAGGDAWLCETTKRMIPEHRELLRLRSKFEAIAKKYNGEYDGWGTGVVN